MLHGIEDCPQLGGRTWTIAGDGANPLFVGGQMHIDCKGKSLVSLVSTGRSNGNRADVAFL